MKTLLDYFLGYVIITIRGKGIERFINLAVQRGIRMWDISWMKDGSVRAKVQLSGIKALRHVARKSHCRFRIGQRQGLPFWVKFFQKRKMLAAGAIFFVLSLYELSSFAFSVQVTSPEPLKIVNEQMIKRLAEEKGIKPGRPKWLMDFKAAEKYLIKEVPQLTWVNISAQGTRLCINVVEKVMPEPDEKNNKSGNIIALKDGIITEILVMKGEPLVTSGDTVSQGQVLISGIITIQEEFPLEEEPLGKVEKVKADGIVRARVWYRGYGECPLVESGKTNTGKKAQSIKLQWGKRGVVIWGSAAPEFEYYISDTNRRKLTLWRNITLPVEIITTTCWEQEVYKTVRSQEDAWQKAVNAALLAARRQVPAQAKIISRQLKPVEEGVPGLKRAYVILETEEDIGKFISIE
ncbi:MAG: sporulation protein YqfD [Clostridia bacterium]|nr:sporulation protein YqfD [Clostridia bacterium]